MDGTVIRKTKYDTCFFERYAKLTLETVLGSLYSGLENLDRPDLQDSEHSIGIEVTRAIHESKADAVSLLNEMAVEEVVGSSEMTSGELYKIGYTYGLVRGDIVGPTEYRYWCEASPMNRVLENKVRKMSDGFYGRFRHAGLYIFTKDDMTRTDLMLALKRVNDLQYGKLGFDTLFISEIQALFVCNVEYMTYDTYPITDAMRRRFFMEAASL